MINTTVKIAIFASGAGSNAKNLILDSRKDNNQTYKVELVLTNNKNAGVINECKNLGIPCFIWNKTSFSEPTFLIQFLKNNQIDFILLAGFLLKISPQIIENFPKKIINIHPSLLPKYGGDGMYGNKVHEAVIQNQETESGITIHFVNENYDEGEIIFQKRISLEKGDSVDSLKSKIHQLEHSELPKTLRLLFCREI
jgi:phosphoribosylglycinamide formyltransferase 1